MKPRMAPTMMKTVPSGNVLCCMNGAFAVGGTEAVTGWIAPDSLGRPVRAPPVVTAEPVMLVAPEA